MTSRSFSVQAAGGPDDPYDHPHMVSLLDRDSIVFAVEVHDETEALSLATSLGELSRHLIG